MRTLRCLLRCRHSTALRWCFSVASVTSACGLLQEVMPSWPRSGAVLSVHSACRPTGVARAEENLKNFFIQWCEETKKMDLLGPQNLACAVSSLGAERRWLLLGRAGPLHVFGPLAFLIGMRWLPEESA